MRLRHELRPIPSLRLALLLSAVGLVWGSPLAQVAEAQLAPVVQTDPVNDVPLKGLAELVFRSPHSEKVASQKDALIAQVVLRQEGPAKRTIYVRRKGPGQIDIVFIVVTPSDDSYYYHASVAGKLIKAAHSHGTMDPIANQDALNAFKRERDFWLSWAQNDHGNSTQAKTRVPTSSRDK
jgi:hypothetical protein